MRSVEARNLREGMVALNGLERVSVRAVRVNHGTDGEETTVSVSFRTWDGKTVGTTLPPKFKVQLP